MFKVIYSDARAFYSVIYNKAAMRPINKGQIKKLCNYSYNPDLPLQDGVIDHDYWDHMMPPCPWVFDNIGFIPPTPLGECFADIAADMRVGKGEAVVRNIVQLMSNKIKYYSKYGEIDFKPDECALPLKHWALQTQLFWKLYPWDVPGYV